jgi:hypothetical protein
MTAFRRRRRSDDTHPMETGQKAISKVVAAVRCVKQDGNRCLKREV